MATRIISLMVLTAGLAVQSLVTTGCSASAQSAGLWQQIRNNSSQLTQYLKTLQITTSSIPNAGGFCLDIAIRDSSGFVFVGTSPDALFKVTQPCFSWPKLDSAQSTPSKAIQGK